MQDNRFFGLWFSDQHNLHSKTPTSHILYNSTQFLTRSHNLEEVDIVVFGGDFYERLVDASHPDMRLTQHWIRKFLLECLEHNVIVRVLEGTSSHDREQPENFVVQCPDGLDLKWVKELSYEYIEALGIDVFYVPDNMGSLSPDVIWDKTLEILSANGKKEVDYVFFHGAFEYQIPLKFSKHSHSETRWQSIVKRHLFAGHVHKPSEYGKIRVSGSFDRLNHGEEHAKGGYEFWWDPESDWCETKFWENKNALPYYRVLQHPDDTNEDLLDKVNRLIKLKNPIPKSRIQIRGKNGALIKGVAEYLKATYVDYFFDIDTSSQMEKMISPDTVNDLTYEGVSLTKDNFSEHLRQFMIEEMTDQNMMEGSLELLEEFL